MTHSPPTQPLVPVRHRPLARLVLRLRAYAESALTWRVRYEVRQFLRTSFWIWPLIVMLLAITLLLPVLDWLTTFGDPLGFLWHDLNPDRAKVILTSLTGSTLTFLVFVLSSLVMVVQLASAQLTPRIMEFTLSDIQAKVMTCALLFSFLFGTAVLGRVEEGGAVPILEVKLTVIAALISVILFLRFIPHLSMSLRPISLMQQVAAEGEKAVESIYPNVYDTAAAEKAPRIPRARMHKEGRVIPYEGKPGVFKEFGAMDLVHAAEAADGIIELECHVGNFLTRGDPLFLVYPPDAPVDSRALHGMVAIGRERTLEQDPVFAFRVIVDIANRALSPAINDPTTAVLAIDQIERLLRYVGSRRLDPGMVTDSDGTVRLIIPVPKWSDYVSLAVSEIRLYGANSIQVPRRLMAMLEHLIEVLPEPRAAALQEEMQFLARAVKREFIDVAERERASTGDRQGVGGGET